MDVPLTAAFEPAGLVASDDTWCTPRVVWAFASATGSWGGLYASATRSAVNQRPRHRCDSRYPDLRRRPDRQRRAGFHPPSPRETRPMPRILIAGAGIGGLTAALALLQRGHEVHAVRTGHRTARGRRRRATLSQRHARADRARPATGDGTNRLRTGRQGDPPLEHRADLEAVRPRRDLRRPLRRALLDGPSRRLPRRAARRSAARRPRCDPHRRRRDRLRADRQRHHPAPCLRRARPGRRADRRRRRALGDPPAHVRRRAARSSPASWPGAA